MFQQVLDPVAGSLTLSALIATLPLVTIFILLGVLKVKAQWAALAALGVALVVAIAAFRMPVGMALTLEELGRSLQAPDFGPVRLLCRHNSNRNSHLP